MRSSTPRKRCWRRRKSSGSRSGSLSVNFEAYPLQGAPEGLGFEVLGLDLAKRRPSEEVLEELERLMALRGFAVFRGQHDLSGDDQVKVSAYFGGKAIHSTHGVHPRAPNEHIFRLSNDSEHGILGVGPQWHNDGSFLEAPFSHVGYYSVRAPRQGGGETIFASTALPWSLGEDEGFLSEEEKAHWSRLASINSNSGVIHPVVFAHELTGRTHIYLHLGMTGAVLDCPGIENSTDQHDISRYHLLDKGEMRALFNRYNDLLNDPRVHWKHAYAEGDLVVIDNLAVAHKAHPSAHQYDAADAAFAASPANETCRPENLKGLPLDYDKPSDAALRIVHRTTVRGLRPFHAPRLLPGLPALNMAAGHPFNEDGVWEPGGLGFRWDESIRMQN